MSSQQDGATAQVPEGVTHHAARTPPHHPQTNDQPTLANSPPPWVSIRLLDSCIPYTILTTTLISFGVIFTQIGDVRNTKPLACVTEGRANRSLVMRVSNGFFQFCQVRRFSGSQS